MKLMQFIRPTNDFAFKRLFGSQDKSIVVISFLNSILGLTGDSEIKSVTIADPHNQPEHEEIKMSIIEIKSVDQADSQFFIEMHHSWPAS